MPFSVEKWPFFLFQKSCLFRFLPENLRISAKNALFLFQKSCLCRFLPENLRSSAENAFFSGKIAELRKKHLKSAKNAFFFSKILPLKMPFWKNSGKHALKFAETEENCEKKRPQKTENCPKIAKIPENMPKNCKNSAPTCLKFAEKRKNRPKARKIGEKAPSRGRRFPPRKRLPGEGAKSWICNEKIAINCWFLQLQCLFFACFLLHEFFMNLQIAINCWYFAVFCNFLQCFCSFYVCFLLAIPAGKKIAKSCKILQ